MNTATPEGQLLNSQFTDNNISFRAGIKPFKGHELKFNYQRFNARDVGIPGGSAFPVSAIASYPAGMRQLYSAAYIIKYPVRIIDQFEIRYFHQYILRDVELITGPAVSITPSGYHRTNGILIQCNRQAGSHHRIIGGLDIWQRHLETEREKTVIRDVKDSLGNIVDQIRIVRGEIPVPASSFTSTGIFLQDQAGFFRQKLMFTFGGRFDLIHVRNDKTVDPSYIINDEIRDDHPPDQRITFETGYVRNFSWSADISLLYHPFPDYDVTLTGSRSFRSPSLEERFKYIDLGSTVRIGDPELLPEDGYFFDAGMRIWKERFHFTGNIFVNTMKNLIAEVQDTAYYNYSDQPGRTDTIPALINSNVARARLYGFDATASYNFFDGLTLTASISFVRGKDLVDNKNLPQIPALNGRLGLRYNLPEIAGIEFYSNLVADQDKIAGGERATTGYASYDLSLYTAQIKTAITNFSVSGGIQNITDRAYMNHLSTNRGVIKYEPGRNFYIRLKLEF
jgi:outer membrane receptor protein involved in Fe transport